MYANLTMAAIPTALTLVMAVWCIIVLFVQRRARVVSSRVALTRHSYKHLQGIAPAKSSTFASVAATNQNKVSKIKASVELKLFINSLVIFVVMVVKASLFMRGSYGLDDLFEIPFYSFNLYMSDLFSLSSPIVLVCTSNIARSAMLSALKQKRYSPT